MHTLSNHHFLIEFTIRNTSRRRETTRIKQDEPPHYPTSNRCMSGKCNYDKRTSNQISSQNIHMEHTQAAATIKLVSKKVTPETRNI